MPKEYPRSEQPSNLGAADNRWNNEGGNEKFFYEVRETREFSVEDIQTQLGVIYGLGPEDFANIDIKKENTGIWENVELHLKPELSMELFGHQVSFEFTVEGKVDKTAQASITNISRTDFYDDDDIRGESLADYDRTTGQWIMQPDSLQINRKVASEIPAHMFKRLDELVKDDQEE